MYFGAKGAFGNFLGSVSQKRISQKSTKGGPFESAGERIPEGRVPRPLPLNALVYMLNCSVLSFSSVQHTIKLELVILPLPLIREDISAFNNDFINVEELYSRC